MVSEYGKWSWLLDVNTEGITNFGCRNVESTWTERLLRSVIGWCVQIRLCKLSIYHFQQYVHLTPGDPDNGKINEAVSILQQRLDTFNKLNTVTTNLCILFKFIHKFTYNCLSLSALTLLVGWQGGTVGKLPKSFLSGTGVNWINWKKGQRG